MDTDICPCRWPEQSGRWGVWLWWCLSVSQHSSHHLYSPACCLSQSPRVYMHTPSTGRLVVERLERDRALAPATFLPRNKTIVCWWYEIVGYQGVTATTSPSEETMAGQSRDKIVQVASSSSGCAVLGWGRLNKSKVTTGDDYLDKPYLVSV